ncbi:MAG: 16S rRNA (guanine(527)-N(7))-methyltransferase RsmG [Myxococcaceae bacterium]
MDNAFHEVLKQGLAWLKLEASPELVRGLELHADELLKWNQKVNLTAVSDPAEVAEKHLVDSLTVLSELEGATTLLDLGTGGGFPGIPVAVARPDLQVTLVDAVQKKVAFLKNVVARAGLAKRVVAAHVHANGKPEAEKLPVVDAVVARAFTEPDGLLKLAAPYLKPGGRVVAMLGRWDQAALEKVAADNGYRLVGVRAFTLPRSGDPRAVARFDRST